MTPAHFEAAPAVARSPDQVAKVVGVGRTKIFEAIKEGKLRARKLGRRTIVTDEDLRAWLASLPQVHQGSAA